MKTLFRMLAQKNTKVIIRILTLAAAVSGIALTPAIASANTTITSGSTLASGQAVTASPGSPIHLSMNLDGNLVLYNGTNVLWQSVNTASPYANSPNSHAVMQGDGNLVVYNASGQPLWWSGTNHPGANLVVQDDGNLAMYNADGSFSGWATNTNVPAPPPHAAPPPRQPAPPPPPPPTARGNEHKYQTFWWGARFWLNHNEAVAEYKAAQASGSFSSFSFISQFVPSPVSHALNYVGCISTFVNEVKSKDVGYGVVIDISYRAIFWSCDGAFSVWAQ